MLPSLRFLRSGLGQPSFGFSHGRYGGIVLGLLLFVILLGEQFVLKQFGGAVEIRLGALQFGFVFLQRGLRGGDAVRLDFIPASAAAESARAVAMDALCATTSALAWTDSILATTWPLWTWSPSFTRISVMGAGPMVFAPRLM